MIYLVIGLIVGFLVGWVLKPRLDSSRKHLTESEIDLPDRYENKAENIAKLKEHLKGAQKITNKEVCELLKVSDATAVRYLNELEKEGVVKQVGKTGQDVFYEHLT